jgi:hypothetical protein
MREVCLREAHSLIPCRTRIEPASSTPEPMVADPAASRGKTTARAKVIEIARAFGGPPC